MVNEFGDSSMEESSSFVQLVINKMIIDKSKFFKDIIFNDKTI